MDRNEAGLELDDDPQFHRRVWRFQRAGWIGMHVAVVAGLVGLLGPGPLSRTWVEQPSGLGLEHARFSRAEAPDVMRVRLPPPARPADSHRVAVSRALLDRVRIDRVEPPPIAAEAWPDRVVYAFSAAVTPSPAPITLHFTPRATGIIRAEIGPPGLPPLTMWMFVYP